MNNHKIIKTFLPKQLDIKHLDILLPALQKSNLIVHGEIHGIKENANIVYTLVKKLAYNDWPLKLALLCLTSSIQ
jgi:hypothetical protein